MTSRALHIILKICLAGFLKIAFATGLLNRIFHKCATRLLCLQQCLSDFGMNSYDHDMRLDLGSQTALSNFIRLSEDALVLLFYTIQHFCSSKQKQLLTSFGCQIYDLIN